MNDLGVINRFCYTFAMQTPAPFPDDVDALKVKLAAAEQRAARQDERIAQLEKLLADYKRALFGSKSEKIHPDQIQLQLEELETAIASVQTEADDKSQPKPKAKKKRNTNRGNLPSHLPRIEVVVEPESTTCACGHAYHQIVRMYRSAWM